MAAASKFSANERLVRKRLAARLRQRRCRERKREAAALTVKKEVDVQVGTNPSTTQIQKPVLHQEQMVVGGDEVASSYAVGDHPSAYYPRPSGSWNEAIPEAAAQAMADKRPSSLLESATKSPRSDYGPVPVSPGNSTAEAEAFVKAPPTNKPLASQEMAAIDAMLALRSNDASSADEAEEETASTSSLSSKGDRSSQPTLPKGRMKVPETVYHHHYRPVPPPPTHGYYHYHHHHHLVAPPQPWGHHYVPHHHPYHPLPPPPPQPSYYLTRPFNGKPQPSSSATVASRVRA